MRRVLMQAYIKDAAVAVAFYQKTFDAEVTAHHLNEDGTLMHAEIDLDGHVLALSENRDDTATPGSVMQFALHYERHEAPRVKAIYAEISTDAQVLVPLSPCEFSPLMADVIDKFGIRWCIYV